MTEIERLDALIEAGYGDTPQDRIPAKALERILNPSVKTRLLRRKRVANASQAVRRIASATRAISTRPGALERRKRYLIETGRIEQLRAEGFGNAL